jgi:hypothetical protein
MEAVWKLAIVKFNSCFSLRLRPAFDKRAAVAQLLAIHQDRRYTNRTLRLMETPICRQFDWPIISG